MHTGYTFTFFWWILLKSISSSKSGHFVCTSVACFWSGESEEQFLIKARWHIDPSTAPRRPIFISTTLDAFTGNQLKSIFFSPSFLVFQLSPTRVSPIWSLNMVYTAFWSMTPTEEAVLFVCTVTLRVLCHRAVQYVSTKDKRESGDLLWHNERN